MIFDRMENAKRYESLGAAWWAAFDLMARYDASAFRTGKTAMPAGLYLSQMEETLKAAPEAFEAHRRYADLMFMAEGEETVFYTPAAELRRITSAYDAESDCLLAAPQPGAVPLPLGRGTFAAFFPEDAHAPGCGSGTVRRVVIKVPLD